jgi:hypothetical protein
VASRGGASVLAEASGCSIFSITHLSFLMPREGCSLLVFEASSDASALLESPPKQPNSGHDRSRPIHSPTSEG